MKEITLIIVAIITVLAIIVFFAIVYVALVLWVEKNSDDLDFDDDYIDLDE